MIYVANYGLKCLFLDNYIERDTVEHALNRKENLGSYFGCFRNHLCNWSVTSGEPRADDGFNWDVAKDYEWGDCQELVNVNIYNSMKQLLVSISQFMCCTINVTGLQMERKPHQYQQEWPRKHTEEIQKAFSSGNIRQFFPPRPLLYPPLLKLRLRPFLYLLISATFCDP